MAITLLQLTAAGRNASFKSSDFNRSYVATWLVVVDSPLDGPATIANHASLPARYAPYTGYEATSDPFALCTDLKVSQDGDVWAKWTVTATFETNFTNQQPDQNENPTDDPVVRWLEIEFEKKKVTKEWNGNSIRNSTGQLLDGIERDDAVGVYCFERNELEISSYAKTFNNSLNNAKFYDLLPREGLMRITVGKPETRNGTTFYKHMYRVRVNPDTWDIEPADRGTLVRGSDGKYRKPLDDTNNPMDGEVMLDGAGARLGVSPTTNFPLPIVYLPKKKLYQPQPWAFLNLEY